MCVCLWLCQYLNKIYFTPCQAGLKFDDCILRVEIRTFHSKNGLLNCIWIRFLCFGVVLSHINMTYVGNLMPNSMYSNIIIISSSTDIPDPLSPSLPIAHCSQQVFRDTSHIGTELLYVSSYWTSCLCLSMWRGPQEYITYELLPTSPAVYRTSGSSILIVFVMGDEWPYRCCFVGCCLQDLFNISYSILL